MTNPKKRCGGSKKRWWAQRRVTRLAIELQRKAGFVKAGTGAVAEGLRWSSSVVSVPKHLLAETDQQREELRNSIDSAIRLLARDRTRVKFDFSRVVRIYPGGMLIFLAHFELLQILHPGRVKIRCTPGTIACQLLQHLDVEALGMPRRRSAPTHDSVINWRYLTGVQAEGHKITELLNFYRDTVRGSIPEGLYDVLVEALTNMRHHAFPEKLELHETLKKWWLFSRYDAPSSEGEDGRLFIAIYDIGVGIPGSLRMKLEADERVVNIADGVLGAVGAESWKQLDKILLGRAIDEPRSSTGLVNRGLGLPEMKDFVMSTENGGLHIVSGGAQYSCLPSKRISSSFAISNGFQGTLIVWSIPIKLR